MVLVVDFSLDNVPLVYIDSFVPLKVAAKWDQFSPKVTEVSTECHWIPSNMENFATCCGAILLLMISSNVLSLLTIVNSEEPFE